MEHVSRLFGRIFEKRLKYHLKCAPLKLSHLLFANDVMIFTKPSRNEFYFSILLQALGEFAQVTSLAYNLHKSHVFVAGIDDG